MLTKQKRSLNKDIKRIDEVINDKDLLQKEYIKRNEKLPLKKKIFSARILTKLMAQEREEKLKEIEKLNQLLNPKKFVAYKKEMEKKYEYLKLTTIKDIEKEIENTNIKFQKIFIKSYRTKLEKIQTKSELMESIYEFRYYNLLPFNHENNIQEVKEIEKELRETRRTLLDKGQELKVMIVASKNKDVDEQILKQIFNIRLISLEEIQIKLIKEKDKFYVQVFDEDVFEEKTEIENLGNINKKDLEIKINKKIKVFG